MPADQTTRQPVLDALITRLHARGRVRVWSLVITIFGDAIVPRGGRVALSTLQEVVARLNVEPGALRTAMSRLAADGWVEREREGRNSFFRLADAGRHAFDLATRRIYAPGPPEWNGGWIVAVAPPGEGAVGADELVESGFLKINANVYLRPQTDDDAAHPGALDGMLVIHGSSADHPEMLRDLWPSEDIATGYRDLIEAFEPLRGQLTRGAPLPPLESMAARTLLIHDWRRVVLRDPGLPKSLLPQDWPGEAARSLVRDLYRLLAEPSEHWLDKAGAGPRRQWTRFVEAG
ncbi:MAG: phenylacetic acid degradation protein [Brucellaceae bacterium]|nr:phenylacetic acid degradation protein [Brucellaceae bacterium]